MSDCFIHLQQLLNELPLRKKQSALLARSFAAKRVIAAYSTLCQQQFLLKRAEKDIERARRALSQFNDPYTCESLQRSTIPLCESADDTYSTASRSHGILERNAISKATSLRMNLYLAGTQRGLLVAPYQQAQERFEHELLCSGFSSLDQAYEALLPDDETQQIVSQLKAYQDDFTQTHQQCMGDDKILSSSNLNVARVS